MGLKEAGGGEGGVGRGAVTFRRLFPGWAGLEQVLFRGGRERGGSFPGVGKQGGSSFRVGGALSDTLLGGRGHVGCLSRWAGRVLLG